LDEGVVKLFIGKVSPDPARGHMPRRPWSDKSTAHGVRLTDDGVLYVLDDPADTPRFDRAIGQFADFAPRYPTVRMHVNTP
jgi:hypothetical protein